jgi:alpha-tubulin suppressor-like RCC1 family protein
VILKFEDGIYKVQVSTSFKHVVAVKKAGQLFTWGDGSHGCLGHNNSCGELWPKRVEHGRLLGCSLCAFVGINCSAAIDSSGLVPIFCFSII